MGTYPKVNAATPMVSDKARWVWGSASNFNYKSLSNNRVGDGWNNTRIILNSTYCADPAPAGAQSILYFGLSHFINAHGEQWFLPCPLELKLIFSNNLIDKLYPDDDFSTTSWQDYWTSYAEDTSKVMTINIETGETSSVSNTSYKFARMCRAFF